MTILAANRHIPWKIKKSSTEIVIDFPFAEIGVDHPYPPYRDAESVEVGFVMEHRFAFYFWLQCKQKLRRDRRTSKLIDDDQFRPPDLVTWDWHNDFGSDDDVVEEQLIRLNQADGKEVALYVWSGLRPSNDGHIRPAMWLNALGNVYIIQKQVRNCGLRSRVYKDRFGNDHHVFYFRSLKHFPKTFEESNTGTGVIWDIDLDYFTQGRRVPDQWYTPALTSEEITAMLSPDTSWMPLILRDLKAITIALEPKYTGGLSISLELYRHWESALFSVPLFNKRCRWRQDLR